MVAKIEGGKVTLYSRNGKIISHSYIEVAKALEGVTGDAVIDGELVALDSDGRDPDSLMGRRNVLSKAFNASMKVASGVTRNELETPNR
jgi:ATP-dependent DNA ligase